MPSYLTPKLEFSTDPLSVSNAAAAWKDVTRYCITMDWQSGTSREFDDPTAGSATFVLKNSQRRFEPEYAAGAYYPNIVPGRRFRITLTADGSSYQQGVWYAQSWNVEYPAGTTYSTVTVQCTDGFWRLALKRLGQLSPPTAASYQDVIMDDDPFAYYPLDEESGKTMNSAVGNTGVYKGVVLHTKPNPVLGDPSYAIFSDQDQTYGRAKVDDETTWADSGEVSCDIVVERPDSSGASGPYLILGPFRTATTADYIFGLQAGNAWVYSTATTQILASGTSLTVGRHHVAMTYDGSTVRYYLDGVLNASATGAGANPVTPDAGEYIRIGGNGVASGLAFIRDRLSHAAVYTYALTSDQVAAHADAALNKGYAAQTSGARIAALATDSLWSTAGIATGTVTAAPRFQTGQTALDEIVETTKIEQPGSFFYFDDQGNPDSRALLDTQTVSAVIGDHPGETQYDQIVLTYNDELYNSANVSGEGLTGATAENTSSISDYGTRAQDATGLIITSQADARLLSQTIVDRFSTPAFRCDQVTLNAADQDARTQILSREVGDTIRVKRRGEGGTAIDIITRILSKQKHLDTNGHLTCTWTLARGFNAASAVDHLGVTGYSELGSAFILS